MLRTETDETKNESTAQSNNVGAVVSVQICPGHRAPMRMLGSAQVVENRGIVGDRHARANGSRQVLLIEEETLRELDIPIGAVKENITTRGIELMRLSKGTRVQVGEAIFQITVACTPCLLMDEIRPGLKEELKGQRGMLARVVRGGEIRVGDEIRVMSDDD